jgi:hypothetical protein
VTIEYIPDIIPELPLTIKWSQVDRINDAAEVVDGRWKITEAGIRTLEPYYDRVVAIGDTTWMDFDVSTKVIFHKMLADNPVYHKPPFSSHAHASLLLRWRGHQDDGKQPRVKWYPCGGLVMWRADVDVPGNQFIWHGGESGILKKEPRRQKISLGIPYNLRAQVRTLKDSKVRYAVKGWQAGIPEPNQWELVAIDSANDLRYGSLLLVAHHADVTFGDVTVQPLSSE